MVCVHVVLSVIMCFSILKMSIPAAKRLSSFLAVSENVAVSGLGPLSNFLQELMSMKLILVYAWGAGETPVYSMVRKKSGNSLFSVKRKYFVTLS